MSSGVEIAVASVLVASSKDWSKSAEVTYRKKFCKKKGSFKTEANTNLNSELSNEHAVKPNKATDHL